MEHDGVEPLSKFLSLDVGNLCVWMRQLLSVEYLLTVQLIHYNNIVDVVRPDWSQDAQITSPSSHVIDAPAA